MSNFFKLPIVLFILFSTILFSFTTIVFADDISFNEIENQELSENILNIELPVSSNNVLPKINSRAAVIIDRNSNTILLGKNEFNKVKMASTTKIMTAIIVIENSNLKNIVTVSKKAASTGGSRLGLKTGDKISINDLLYGLLLCSGNDAAVTLAEYIGGNITNFSNLMNIKANELELTNTHFESPHGLDSDNHFTTAYELAILTNYALKNKTFAQIVGTKTSRISINNFTKTLSNSNELLGILNGVYGVKTGFTNGANRCLVTACLRNNLDIICVVLGADTKNFRTTDSIKLIEYTFMNFTPTCLTNIANSKFEEWKKENTSFFTIKKASNNSNEITLKLDTEFNKKFFIPIKNSEIENLTTNINCNKILTAPLYINNIIGKIDISLNNLSIYESNILISTNIYRKGFIEYFFELIKKLKN